MRKFCGVESLALQPQQAEPLSAESIEQRPRSRIGEQALHLRFENRGLVKRAVVRKGGELRIGHRRPEQIREAGGQLVVVERDDGLPRRGLAGGRDEEELRGNEYGLEHQTQRRRVVEFVLACQIEDAEQQLEFCVRCRPAKGAPSQRTRDRFRRHAKIRAGCGRFAEEPILHLSGGSVLRSQNSIQHFVGDAEIMLRLERRQRIEIPLAEHLIRQLRRDRRSHSEDVPQRIAIFHLGQPTDHKRPRVLRAEIFDRPHPVDEHLPLLILRLLVRVARRHVVRLHIGQCLLPFLGRGGNSRSHQRRCKVDASLHSMNSMTIRAVRLEEGGDAILENFLRLRLPGGEIRLLYRRSHRNSRRERQGHSNEDQSHQVTAKSSRSTERKLLFGRHDACQAAAVGPC